MDNAQHIHVLAFDIIREEILNGKARNVVSFMSVDDMASFLQVHDGGVCLSVRLQPRASSNEIGETVGNELKIKVTAPPVDSAANEALLRLLKEKLDCPRNALQILRGQTSRHKTVFIQGLSVAEIQAKLLNN